MLDYVGWSLFDKVQIVAKPCREWRNGDLVTTSILQGYVVDPNDTRMLKSAIRWGTESRRLDEKNENGCYVYETIEPSQYLFDNKDFTLQLLDSAQGSSQGGKLSFWNCLVTKDDHQFKIGIASNLLLQLLKQSTFVNGVCQDKVFFARCKGEVGMIHKDMEEYRKAVADMEATAAVKSAKKTQDWEQGCNYRTLTYDSTMLSKVSRWVEPVYVTDYTSALFPQCVVSGIKILSKPVKQYLTATTNDSFTKLSQYFKETDISYCSTIYDKCPTRPKGITTVEIDMTPEDINNKLNQYAYCALLEREKYEIRKVSNLPYVTYIPDKYLGLSAGDAKWVMPDNIREQLEKMGLEVIEE